MFHTSGSIDPALMERAEKIDNAGAGFAVLAGRIMMRPVYTVEATFDMALARGLHVLEQFVLKAAVTIEPAPTVAELSDAFALHDLFVEATAERLRRAGLVHDDKASGGIRATNRGIEALEQGQMNDFSETVVGSIEYDPLSATMKLLSFADRRVSTGMVGDAPVQEQSCPPAQDLWVKMGREPLNNDNDIRHDLARVLGADAASAVLADAGFLNGVDEGSVQAVNLADSGRLAYATTWLFLVYDAVEEVLFTQALDVATGRRLHSLEASLDSVLADDKGDAAEAVFGVAFGAKETMAPRRETVSKNQRGDERLRLQLSEQRATAPTETNDTIPFGYVSGPMLRHRFLQVLASAEHEILIMSGGGISEEVIDDEFVQLLSDRARRGVLVLLGWGLEPTMSDRDRERSAAVARQLVKVRTADGLPAAALVWIGNSHRKEVAVDGTVGLIGSQNWLSYRGDYRPRGESAFVFQESAGVMDMIDAQTEAFLPRLRRHWRKYISDPTRHRERDLCLIGWSALDRQDIALDKLMKAAGTRVESSGGLGPAPETRLVSSPGLHTDLGARQGGASLLSSAEIQECLYALVRYALRRPAAASLQQHRDAIIRLVENVGLGALSPRRKEQMRSVLAHLQDGLALSTGAQSADAKIGSADPSPRA